MENITKKHFGLFFLDTLYINIFRVVTYIQLIRTDHMNDIHHCEKHYEPQQNVKLLTKIFLDFNIISKQTI